MSAGKGFNAVYERYRFYEKGHHEKLSECTQCGSVGLNSEKRDQEKKGGAQLVLIWERIRAIPSHWMGAEFRGE